MQIERSGKLTVPADAALVPFSTDPTVAEVLGQDFGAAHRGASAGTPSPLTVTVTVSQQQLKPGVSLNQLAPGDPQVADLIKAAGATPPPIGDTGDKSDEAAIARARAQRLMVPHDNPMQQLINQFEAPQGELGPPVPCDPQAPPGPGCAPVPQPTPRPRPDSPGYTGDTQQYMQQGTSVRRFFSHDDAAYQTVIVARVTLSGAPDEMTVVGVTQPGEDVREAKKLVAENIANAVLH
ncbi:MAG TPA: hypothetical protein VEF07_08590 [Candidatus Binataceae bacterium]|nr:hypothetical protein [Candidatus Binataceae bacterium]